MNVVQGASTTFPKPGAPAVDTIPEGNLVEIMERDDHPWFVGVQFHPELKSTPFKPHPIFNSYIKELLKNN